MQAAMWKRQMYNYCSKYEVHIVTNSAQFNDICLKSTEVDIFILMPNSECKHILPEQSKKQEQFS